MSTTDASHIPQRFLEALRTVIDPELHRPITDLDMVEQITASAEGLVNIKILLTVAACPLRATLASNIETALRRCAGVTDVAVEFGVMTTEQRAKLRRRVGFSQGALLAAPPRHIFAVASGKGGVGKSTLTANLACALAKTHLRVGIVDADIYGFSIPRLMGLPVSGQSSAPTNIDGMVIPPEAHGVKVISVGMFLSDNKPVVWRGPLLHRALQQFLQEVHFGELDVLFLDLPPGTGDIAISVAQLLPQAHLVLTTTPQPAASDVAERAGALVERTGQSIVGVVENMSWFQQPDGRRWEIFGSGGGAAVAQNLSRQLGVTIPLLGQIPLDISLRQSGDTGTPLTLTTQVSPTQQALERVAAVLIARSSSAVSTRELV